MKKKEIKYILITLGCLFKNISLGLIPIVLISFYSCNSDPILENNKIIETSEPYLALGYVELPYGNDNLLSELDRGDRFGRDHDKIGDVDGDGVIDLVVGARSDDDGEIDAGAVYILFMNHDGSLKSHQKISMISGGFSDVLNEGNFFGYGVAGIGDYNYDGIPDIAVSSPVPPNNSLYIIHLNTDGTVKSYTKNQNIIAEGLTAIGDINGDNRIDIVACNPGSDDGGRDRGAIDIIFLNEDSYVENLKTITISSSKGGFGSGIEDGDKFGGREVAMMGDIDKDGTIELAVGAFMSDEGKGAIWMLSLNSSSFNVESKIKITEGMGGFTDQLITTVNPNGSYGANFGHAMAAIGDVDGDGVVDLITGANQQYEGWGYILYLNNDKTVKSFSIINNSNGGFNINLPDEGRFSRSISYIGDLKGDGSIAVNLGGGAGDTGSLYTLFFKSN